MTDLAIRFKVRRGTAANLASVNETPLAGELVIETDTRKTKLGDGATAYNSLPYATVVPGAVTTSGLTMATARLLGRSTASTGAIEEISLGNTLALSGGVLSLGVLIGQSAAAAAHTGTTAETTLATITIPANAMGANGRVEIEVLWSATNNANVKTARAKFGATTILSTALTSNASLRISNFVANRNATNSQIIGANTGTGFGASTSAVVTAAIDTTAAVNITITAQLANAADTMTLEAYRVLLFK